MSGADRTRGSASWWRRCTAAGAAVAVALLAASCTTAHSELGTADSPCFVALPGAYSAVHHRGTLLGVRLISWSTMRSLAPEITGELGAERAPAKVCAIAFGGRFHPGQVERPSGATASQLAVVVLRYPNAHLVTTYLAHRAPLRFGHPHLAS